MMPDHQKSNQMETENCFHKDFKVYLESNRESCMAFSWGFRLLNFMGLPSFSFSTLYIFFVIHSSTHRWSLPQISNQEHTASVITVFYCYRYLFSVDVLPKDSEQLVSRGYFILCVLHSAWYIVGSE